MKMYFLCYRYASLLAKLQKYICLCKCWQICISISRHSYLFCSFKTL